MARIIGILVIAFTWIVVVGIGAVTLYEYVFLTESEPVPPLTRVGYYKTHLLTDPYKPFRKQHLHPIYLFFFPLDPRERAALTNEVVSLTPDGFRGQAPSSEKATAVLLGGSAAFGSKASSDNTTVTGYLNQLQTSVHFVNAGVPSWTSTQELQRLANQIAALRPKLVISYSFSNDIVTALRYAQSGLDYPPGSPESFDSLSELVNDVRGSVPRYLTKTMFPRTTKFLSKKFAQPTPSLSDEQARAAVEIAADKFVWNQKVMHAIANSLGFRFVTVLQPTLRTHKHVSAKDRGKAEDWWLFEYAVQRIIASDYCRDNCLDYSSLFDEPFDEVPVYRKKDDRRPATLIFADEVHLFDSGYKYVAQRLIRDLELAPVDHE
jgi:lysophospholipase L1-like esterase